MKRQQRKKGRRKVRSKEYNKDVEGKTQYGTEGDESERAIVM